MTYALKKIADEAAEKYLQVRGDPREPFLAEHFLAAIQKAVEKEFVSQSVYLDEIRHADELERELAEARSALGNLHEHTEYYQDDGPQDESWQSDELKTALSEAKRIADKRKALDDVRLVGHRGTEFLDAGMLMPETISEESLALDKQLAEVLVSDELRKAAVEAAEEIEDKTLSYEEGYEILIPEASEIIIAAIQKATAEYKTEYEKLNTKLTFCIEGSRHFEDRVRELEQQLTETRQELEQADDHRDWAMRQDTWIKENPEGGFIAGSILAGASHGDTINKAIDAVLAKE